MMEREGMERIPRELRGALVLYSLHTRYQQVLALDSGIGAFPGRCSDVVLAVALNQQNPGSMRERARRCSGQGGSATAHTIGSF